MPCWMYEIYHWMKQTRMASWLFFGGERFEYVCETPVLVMGDVRFIYPVSGDGDFCFDLQHARCYPNDPEYAVPMFHCEITPCYRDLLAGFIKTLTVGDAVVMSGPIIYDPPHSTEQGNRGWYEVRPTAAENMTS